MVSTVRPTPEQFRETYEHAFQVWTSLHLRAVGNPDVPAFHLAKDAFHQHPYFPPNLQPKHVHPTRKDTPPRLYATGSSVWASPACKNGVDFASFQQQLEIEVAISSPATLSIAIDELSQEGPRTPPWFVRSDTNLVSILILAWAYILSARLTELLTEDYSLSYTGSRAKHIDNLSEQSPDRSAVYVDIGTATLDEIRWWTAVLAPGQGWQSIVNNEHHVSPWSISLRASPSLVVRTATSVATTPLPPLRTPAVSSLTAIRFLDRFCHRHNIVDQGHVALAAVLLLPCFGRDRALLLPQLRLGAETRPATLTDYREDPSEHQLWWDWFHDEHGIDRLLTLSCNIRGIRPMLLSVFYEPRVDCNLATPWLQGTMAAIDSAARGEPYTLVRMFTEREPSVASLWIGATILGLQEPLLQEVRRGQIQADLHSAIWSGTVQSFLQQPVSNPLVVDGHVTRVDECRLLFLSQSGQHSRAPICQWRPFGATPIEDVDLDVRIHEKCENHALQFRGFSWDCFNGETCFQPSDPATGSRPITKFPSTDYLNKIGRQVPILYDGLDRDKEAVSENATRSIFDWLRCDGHSRHEKDIWSHEWFDIFDSDSEEGQVEDESESTATADQSIICIKEWLSGI